MARNDELTIADVRALLAARGINVRVKVQGNELLPHRLDVTRAQFESWLQGAGLEDGDEIDIAVRPLSETPRQGQNQLWTKGYRR